MATSDLARLIFLSVFIPFVGFLLAGRLSKSMQTKVFVILGLIVFQGFIGWFMVQSGLRNEVRVSPYRLAMHLGLASLLFAMLVAMALGQDQRDLPPSQDLTQSRRWGRALIGLVFALILFGALVAGLRGGRTHDTWPLMEGQLIPSNLLAMSPWIVNFFENPLTAQWLHPSLAYGLLATTLWHWRATIRRDEPETVQSGAFWLVVGVGVQLLLGIVTVLNQVPIPLGLAHQLLAFMLLALATRHLYEVERHIAGGESVTSWTRNGHHGPCSGGRRPACAHATSPTCRSGRAPGPFQRPRRVPRQSCRVPKRPCRRHPCRRHRLRLCVVSDQRPCHGRRKCPRPRHSRRSAARRSHRNGRRPAQRPGPWPRSPTAGRHWIVRPGHSSRFALVQFWPRAVLASGSCRAVMSRDRLALVVQHGRRGMPAIREITSELRFPEGPVALADGSVLLVEIERQTLTKVAADGRKSVVAKTGGGPNGAAFGPDGACYICNNGGFQWIENEPVCARTCSPPTTRAEASSEST